MAALAALTHKAGRMTLRYLSVCSGIEAASVAWHPLGWTPHAFSEVDPFASAVLAHRFPNVPNWGDMTKFKEWPNANIDVLVGGTPCQSFSLAGLRKGLDDPRGNLMLTYLAIAERYRPKWLVWENVPGVLSSLSHAAPDPMPPPAPMDMERDGQEMDTSDDYSSEELHAFECFLSGLSELGYGFAYRVLDAQYVRVDGIARAVPQRRRRVFVVGYLGDWRPPAAVLLEAESLRGNSPPCRRSREDVAGTITRSLERCSADDGERGTLVTGTLSSRSTGGGGGGLGTDFELAGGLVAHPLLAKGNDSHDSSKQSYVAHSLLAHAPRIDAETETLIPVAFRTNTAGQVDYQGDRAAALTTSTDQNTQFVAIAFAENSRQELRLENGDGQRVGALSTGGGKPGQGAPMVAYALRSDAARSGIAKTPSADAEGKIRLRDPGFSILDNVAPTLDSGQPHSVCHDAQPMAFSCKDHGADAADAADGVAPTLRAMGHRDSHANGGGQLAVAFKPSHFTRNIDGAPSDVFPPLSADADADADKGDQEALVMAPAVAFQTRIGRNGRGQPSAVVPALNGSDAGETSDMRPCVMHHMQVRRLTPRECERLQGFPDDHTLILYRGKLAADGPRYKALGNSMAVNCMRWIGQRIAMVEAVK